MSVRIKICGITNPVDALAAADLGVDALGFVFFPKSARYIAPEDAAAVIQKLPPFIARVGVFVNQPGDFIADTAHQCGLSEVQLSGDEPMDFLRDVPYPVIRAVRVKDGGSLQSLFCHRPGTAFVLDSFRPGLFGGTGVPFDWDLIDGDTGDYRIIIAGGLTPENVGDAVERFRPFGVDVASGVEERPGIKDHDKMRRFIRAVKQHGGKIDDKTS